MPELPYQDTRTALEFLQRVFGFREIPAPRIVSADGMPVHAMLEFGGGAIGIGEEGGHGAISPQSGGIESPYVSVYVDDVDAHYQRTVALSRRTGHALHYSPMLTGIDHVVIVVPDLDAAVASYGDLGFTVVRGGRHPIGSHNALIGLADGAYLELIAFFEPTAQHRWRAMLDKGGGLVDVCMQTDDLAADAAAFRAAGVAMGEPWPLSRTRPDGYTLSWILCTPREPHGGLAPFLIEDTTPRDERVPKQRTHANGATGIASLTVAAPDVAAVSRWWKAIPGASTRDVRRDDVGGAGVRITVGPHALDFVAPIGPTSPLGAWIGSREPSPYAVALTTTGAAGAVDERRAVNARLSLVR